LHTSEAERLEQKAKLLETQALILDRAFEFENERIKTQASVIRTEAKSDSVLAKNIRPAIMGTFTLLVVAYWFGVEPENLAPETVAELFGIIKWGMAGYIGGRSAEKIAKTITESKVTGK